MKGRLPHIILRFSRHVTPDDDDTSPPTSLLPPASSSDKPSSTNARRRYRTSPQSPLSPENNTEPMARRRRRAGTAAVSRKKSKVKKQPVDDVDTASTDSTTTVTTTSTTATPPGALPESGEEIAISDTVINSEHAPTEQPSSSAEVSPSSTISFIGKRKRDIPKSIGGGKGDLQPPNSLRQQKPKTSSTPTTVSGSSPPSVGGSGKKDDEKRVLRSQDTIKKSKYDEWFEAPEVSDDMQMPIDVKELPKANGLGSHTLTKNSLINALSTAAVAATAAVPMLNSPLKSSFAKPLEKPEISRIRSLPIEKIDLEEELRKSDGRHTRFMGDPLADEIFISAHRAAERSEKRSKNIERDVLAHNAVKIQGDLERLRSPDWVKSIGISPAIVSRCSKAELEERKERLVTHLEGILEKHKAWSKGERRKKYGSANSSPQESQERDTEDAHTDTDEDAEYVKADSNDVDSDGDHHRGLSQQGTSSKKLLSALASKVQKKALLEEENEFTSFYSKPYLRDQALGIGRKSARNQTAFGQPVPAVVEKDFELPKELHDASIVAAREVRNRKRLSR